MTMDAKDLRTESINRTRNEFINFEHNDTRSLCPNQSYVDSNTISKMDIQTSRPCAVIGPDRVVPEPLSNLEFNMKKSYTEWNYKGSLSCPDYYEKIAKEHPSRNISPRQTYQENMQRVMIPPHTDTIKNTDVTTNFTSGRNISKNTNHVADSKAIDVPYNVPQVPTEHRNFSNSEMYIPQPAATAIPPHGWTPSNTIPGRTYPQFSPSSMYRYPEYSNHTSYPVPITHSHRGIPEETSHVYSNQFYRPGNMRYEPYPSSKDRLPHNMRYEYINNYPIACNPVTYTSHKVIAPQTYTTYNQMPLKYLRPHVSDLPPERFQRPLNAIHTYNTPYHSHEFTPNYPSTVNANCFPNKMTYANENIIKPKQINKNNNLSKIYPDYDPALIKPCHQSENIYINKMIPPNHTKESVITNFSSLNVQPMSHLFQYQRNINEVPNFKNTHSMPQIKAMPNDNMNYMARLHRQFSPNTPYLDSSPNFNLISTQNISYEGSYINHNSMGKRKSIESGKMLNPEIYKACDSIYESHKSNQLNRESNHNKTKLLRDKNINVRQFIQMWNEGDEENIDGSGTCSLTTVDNFHGNNAPTKTSNNSDQLYVLDLVNVPTEELSKYEHIEKISKLPDNIKGYNHIELLNQFEKVLGSSNVKYECFKPKNVNKPLQRIDNKSSERPLSPLDVEAKISQSVIHKEVGCNFEIKPCSPKALTVDIVAPAQVTSMERQIEKVINPHVQSHPLPSDIRKEIIDGCNLVEQNPEQSKLQREEPSSCKLTETNGNAIEVKTNYSLQEFNTNSGVCLASLPRLDNDIEFNFPEVNQQFLDANNMESAVHESKNVNIDYSIIHDKNNKNSLILRNELQFSESSKLTEEARKHILIDTKNPIPADSENSKESIKLSKFRKIKNNVSKVYENPLNNAQCSDNITVKIGDTKGILSEVDNLILDLDKPADDFSSPMNLSSTKLNVIKYVTNLNAVQDVRKLKNNGMMSTDEAINLVTNTIHNQKDSFEKIIENKTNYEETHNESIQNSEIEQTVAHDKWVTDSKNLMEIDTDRTEVEGSSTKNCDEFYEVNSKNKKMNINENLIQSDGNLVNDYKNTSDIKEVEPLEENCFKNISDNCNYKSQSKAHQMDKSSDSICPDEFDLSLSNNKAVEVIETESKKYVDKIVNGNPLNVLRNSVNICKESIYSQMPCENLHNDPLNYVSSNDGETSKTNSVSDNDSEMKPNQEHNIKENVKEDSIVQCVLETELPFNSLTTNIMNNKNFQIAGIQQNTELQTTQDASENLALATKDDTISTNISTDKFILHCTKQDYANKNIIFCENNVCVTPCNLNFSIKTKKLSEGITLQDSDSNTCLENPDSKQLPSGSPSAKEKTHSTITTKRELHMDVEYNFGNNINNVNMLNSKFLFSTNTSKEESKKADLINCAEVAQELQNASHNKEMKLKGYGSTCRYIFSKEIFSPRVQNLLFNTEGIIVKKKTIQSDILACDTKEVYHVKNFKEIESHNTPSAIKPFKQNKTVKYFEDEMLEKVTAIEGPVEKQLDTFFDTDTVAKSESFEDLPILVDIKENNETIVTNNFNNSYNSTSHLSFSTIRCHNTKDFMDKQPLKCCKCEGSNRNNSSRKSSLRRKLRSLSESDIYEYNLEFTKSLNSRDNHTSWPKKVKRDIDSTLDLDNRYSGFSNNCRRNSIASILNDHNVSVCILIDSDCLITDESLNNVEENECYSYQDDEILYSNKDPVTTTVMVPIENSVQEETVQSNEADICVDKDYGDFWVDDVGCIETIVSDEIEPNENSLSIFEAGNDVMAVEHSETILDKKFDSAKIKAIYGSNILSSDIKLVESLYKTPQMNVNDKLKMTRESPVDTEDENKLQSIPSAPGKPSLNVFGDFRGKSLNADKNIKNKYKSESLTMNNLNISRKNISDNHTVITGKQCKESLHLLSTTDNTHLTYSIDDESDSFTVSPSQTSSSPIETHISVLPALENLSPVHNHPFNTSASSSPEVSSTTSEEKSNILLEICKYETSRASCIKSENESVFFKRGLRCKLTEVDHYGKSNTVKPLITKAAQKYIPPPKKTNNNLKVRLPLPEHSLQKLKRLKISKDPPKSRNNNFVTNKDKESIIKIKPNFEDVLRNIDQAQYKLHKSKCKIKQTIPKVIIKKNENGSHYASTSKMHNPDLTGRKWQPWVFLEKNYFIDRMAIKKNTKAIYCHKRDTYVIADKTVNNKKVEPSGTSTKLIISRPKSSVLKVPLKYTIRWTHPYQ